MASSSNDKTQYLDLERVNNLVNCIESLEAAFQKGIKDGQIDTDEKMISYQNDFWKSHLKCIESCNDTYMTNAQSQNANDCCKKIWDFCCMATLYNQMINGWPNVDLQSRKLTILIAICDIEQFRCEKCKIKTEPTDDHFDSPAATSTPKNQSSDNDS